MEISILPNYQISEKIYESANSIVYRGLRKKDDQAVILKILKGDYPSSEELTRYQREYHTTLRLADLDGVVNAYSLEKHENTLVMCLEDFGGESLEIWLKKQRVFTLDELLKFAIRAAEILGQIHGRNIIHKDINPSNIILNPTSGILKIVDFGMSTQLSKQHLTFKNPDVLESTLAYISPEQTGRMNRALDYRTDFYSLGATFYELFTGMVVFDTKDTMELVHCHIAKQPKPPIQINSDLPPVISNLILKLLEKAAEARYKSAWGLKADLEQCLKQWQTNGQIKSFPLARFDLFEQFTIPQKLYGRDHEIKTLLAAFERASFKVNGARTRGQAEMMLVTGYSGIGKSVLVKEIYQSLAEKQGYFISGKFDQLQRNSPYSAIVNAFGELVRQLLTETEAQLAQWKEKLLIALGPNGQVFIDVVPEIELIIGPQPAVPQLGPTESQNRFNLAFQNVIRVFCQPEHPLVIFLDDLQWIDSATLKLLESIMTDNDNTALFLIGAYRDNEVDPTHPLITTLDKLRQESATINQITLEPLAFKHINQLIADSLQQNLNAIGSLTDLVIRKTGGNPFFVNQFLHTLYEEDLLHFVPPTLEQKGHWQWDIDQIEALNITDNVVDLMTLKLKKLPGSVQHVLRLAACVGNSFDLDTLSIIYEKSAIDTFQSLMPVLTEGVIFPTRELEMSSKGIATSPLMPLFHHFRFLHDRVQQAAYSLIEDDKKKETHLQIGRLLFQEITKDTLQERIFEITDHFNVANEFLKDDHEKIEAAGLNLIAGDKAISSMAGEAAVQYFKTGLSLLPEKGWEEHYSLALNLTCGLIESSYLTTSYQKAEELCNVALLQAHSTHDKARVYSLMCYNFTLQNRMEKTLTTGLEALRILNIPLVENPPEIIDIDQLRDLPEMTNPDSLAAMSILVSIISCALVTQSPLMMPLIYTMVNLSAKYGNCSKAPFGYVWYGCTLCWSLTDIGLGYRFGRLAIDVMEKFKPCEVETKVLHQFNSFIRHWCEHERLSINEFPHVVQVGKETGDIEYGTYVAVNYVTNLLLVGEPLASTQEKQRPYLDWVASTRFSFSLTYGNIWAQATQCLMNQGDSATLLQGDFMDESKMIPEMRETKNNLNLFAVYAAKAMLSYFNARFHESAAFAKEAEQYEEAIGGLLPVTQTPFYGALALLKITSEESSGEPDDNKTFEIYEEKLRLWSEQGHKNFQHKYDLVEAEKERVFGKKWIAAELYEKAIAGAKENEYLHEEALAYELAAEFYLENGMDKFAQTYMKEAHYRYQQWGVLAKVVDLETRYPPWLTPKMISPQMRTNSTIPASRMALTSTGDDSKWLDLNSIMKAAQTLSGEIVLSRLLEKMMHIVIENAGAEKGFLLLPKQDSWFIEAQGHIDSSDTIVLQSLPLEESENMSANIIHYVARTKENVVLRDATQEGSFTSDTYIVKHHPKSVLCAPLLNQGQLTGILYLENNLTTGTFTPTRLKVLNLLSSQITISIENSLLYNNLEKIVAERTSELEQEITERKQADEQVKASLKEKETLLQEIHHRVKNNMTVISSLLKLQMTSVTDEKAKEALQDSQNRVKTMSMIHETLYRSDNLSSIEMQVYLSELGKIILQGYTVSGKVNLKVEAENILIGVKQASPLGLIVNELITNSLKYAFPDDRKGEIFLKLKSNKENEAELTVSDNGIGIPKDFNWQKADSLGLKLVKLLAENQLDGSIDTENKNGTKFTIKFNIDES